MTILRSLPRLLIATAAMGAAHAAAVYLFRSQRARFAGDRRHVLVTQGGTRLRISGSELDDAVISVLMGGARLDLTDAELTAGPRAVRLDVLVVMGGLQVVVPSAWTVRAEADVTMGGIVDRRRDPLDAERPADVVITGRIVMGGLEILSKASAPH